jgi:uncharacterized repeat protein (TIGR03843 family)
MGAPDLLSTGEIEVVGRMPYASNATFLVRVGTGEDEVLAIYKPERGERPLWDFPAGLHRREVAAWVVADHLGWDLVPATVVREDGPFGCGSLQRFVHARVDEHYFTMLEDPDLHDQLRRVAAFDLAINNTARKGGHLLIDDEHHIWCIDNGLAFHAEWKLRTVVWDFAGEDVPAPLLDDLAALAERPLPPELATLLDPLEREALTRRVEALVELGRFPGDPTGRAHPWPLI